MAFLLKNKFRGALPEVAKFLASTCQALVTDPGRRPKGLHSYCWHDPTRWQEDGQSQGFVHKIEGRLIDVVRQHADEPRLGDHQAHHDRCELALADAVAAVELVLLTCVILVSAIVGANEQENSG